MGHRVGDGAVQRVQLGWASPLPAVAVALAASFVGAWTVTRVSARA